MRIQSCVVLACLCLSAPAGLEAAPKSKSKPAPPEAASRDALQTAVELAPRETGLKQDLPEVKTEMMGRYPKESHTHFDDQFTVSGRVGQAGEIIRDDIRRRWTKAQ